MSGLKISNSKFEISNPGPSAEPNSLFAGKVILVTGGNRGIGLAIAEACAHEGAGLALVGRDVKALNAAKRRVPGAISFVADITKEREVNALYASVRRQLKRLDVLVNNAGVFTFKPFVSTSLAEWEKNLSTNLTSLYLMTRSALPLLQRSPAPHIVNILSVSSRRAFPNCSAYCASKFGALGFTRVIAEEFRPLGIRVTAILPGSTSTRMTNEFNFAVARENLLQPGDVANAVLAALRQPARATVDEILLTPSQGNLASQPKKKSSLDYS